MPRTTLERIADREQALTSSADQLREQIAQATARLAEIDAELTDLAVARKVVLTLPEDEPRAYRLPGLPDNPAYQHILTALTDADRPQRCRELCLALDTGIEARHIAGMRNRLKRLTSIGLVAEPEPGLFALPSPRPAG